MQVVVGCTHLEKLEGSIGARGKDARDLGESLVGSRG